MKGRILPLMAVASLLALTARPSEAILLRYKFQPGETLSYLIKTTASGQMTTSMQPTPQPISVSGAILVTYKVLSVNPDGSYNIRVTLQPKGLTISIGGLQQAQVPQAQQGAQPALRPMAFRVLMTPLGEVKKVVMEEQQGQMPGMAVPGAAGGLSPSQFITEITGSTVFPKDDVKVGQVWTGSVSISSPLLQQPIQVVTKSKLTQITTYMGRPCAVIETTTTVPLNFSIPAFSITSSGRTVSTSRTFFDYQAGKVVYSKGNFKIAVSSQAQFQQPGGGTVNFSTMFQMTGQIEVVPYTKGS